jgi:hypothetical protein
MMTALAFTVDVIAGTPMPGRASPSPLAPWCAAAHGAGIRLGVLLVPELFAQLELMREATARRLRGRRAEEPAE